MVALGLLGPGRLRAQAVDSLRYKLDQVFTPLDRSQVPIGLLDAYAHPLVPLAPFNGVLQDSVLLNPDLFRGLYATAYTACIYGDNLFLAAKLQRHCGRDRGVHRAGHPGGDDGTDQLRHRPARCVQPKPACGAEPVGIRRRWPQPKSPPAGPNVKCARVAWDTSGRNQTQP